MEKLLKQSLHQNVIMTTLDWPITLVRLWPPDRLKISSAMSEQKFTISKIINGMTPLIIPIPRDITLTCKCFISMVSAFWIVFWLFFKGNFSLFCCINLKSSFCDWRYECLVSSWCHCEIWKLWVVTLWKSPKRPTWPWINYIWYWHVGYRWW